MPSSPQKIRVGAVSYLNTKPLVYDLADRCDGIELTFDLPSRLANSLTDAELDVALIPSIEMLQRDDYIVISDACIACKGPVWSVRLVSRVPFEEIRSVALDEGSRTSVAMMRILFDQRLGRQPQTTPLAIDADPFESAADAVLIIGDRAMNCSNDVFCHDWDLGDEWFKMTGLPFVFAMWTARVQSGVAAAALTQLESELGQARDCGVANIEQIAREEAARYGLTHEQTVNYLQHNLHFQLGREQCEGLALFRDRAVKLGLAPAHVDINFHEYNAS